MNDSLDAWLRIAAVGSLDTETLRSLLAVAGDAQSIAGASDALFSEAGVTSDQATELRTPSVHLDATRRWLERDDHKLLTFTDAAYPSLLAQLRDAPPLLYVLGNLDALSFPLLAMVGSRKPTRGGLETARQFAAEFAGNGLGIVSGMALGIDKAVHEAALVAGGLTVGVLGTGIDRIYPAANQALAHQMAGEATLISEFPLGTEPRRYNFPRRNRLISGLALGTLVVEAAERSGTLITARLAAEQGREVFAIPGSIHNPMARGCHRLIKDGARLVETTADVFAEIGALTEIIREQLPESGENITLGPENPQIMQPEYQELLEAMGFEPVSIDTLASRSGLTIAELSSMLLILELEAVVEALPGGRYARLNRESQST